MSRLVKKAYVTSRDEALAARLAPSPEAAPAVTQGKPDEAADILALVYRAGLKGFGPPAEATESGDADDVGALARAVGLAGFKDRREGK